MEPAPENVTGQKRVTHSVEHRINWGYMAIGLGLVMVVLYLSGGDSSDDDGVDFNTQLSEGEV